MPSSLRAAQELREEVLEYYDVLLSADAVIDSNDVIIRQSGNDKAVVSWSSSSGQSYLFGSYHSLDQYKELLLRRDFNLCLSDGSCVQVHYELEEGVIVRHRLSYFPCPLSFDKEELGVFGLEGIIVDLVPSESGTRIKMVSPVRFDFDSEFEDAVHAHSHFSMCRDTCRIPVYGPVSVGHFMRFVLKYFHGEYFGLVKDSDSFPKVWSRTITHEHNFELYFDTCIREK